LSLRSSLTSLSEDFLRAVRAKLNVSSRDSLLVGVRSREGGLLSGAIIEKVIFVEVLILVFESEVFVIVRFYGSCKV